MSLTDAQQAEHLEVMTEICHSLNRKGLPMVLKGGTALKLCYGLDKKYVDPAAITLKVRLSGDHHVVKFCREAAPASPVRVHLSVVKSAAAVRSFMGHDMPICFICCVFVLRVGI